MKIKYSTEFKFGYVLLFVEGSILMGLEIAGAKWISSVYGTALYAWSAILIITLIALVIGYFSGGYLSRKKLESKPINLALALASILIVLIPCLSSFMVKTLSNHQGFLGPIISPIIYLLPPLVLLAMISPLVIQQLVEQTGRVGNTSGKAYAISTLGGVFMSLFVGLYAIPEFGVHLTTIILAVILALLTLVNYSLQRKFIALGSYLVLFLGALFISDKQDNNLLVRGKILYESNSLLGELQVVDYSLGNGILSRYLLVNQVPETNVFPDYLPYSVWPYVHRMAAIASSKAAGSDALLIGMAGGTLAMELDAMGMKTDIVELDPRMPALAKKYFGFEPTNARVYIDDGRHFINNIKKKYDLIILDALDGENQPFHLYSLESFKLMAGSLKPDGLILMNYQGEWEGKFSVVPRSIIKTMDAAQLYTQIYTPANKSGDLVLLGALHDYPSAQFNDDRVNPCCISFDLIPSKLSVTKNATTDKAFILTDNQPMLEKLNFGWTIKWRKKMVNEMFNSN